MRTKIEDEAIERLWKNIPVGSGADFNTVLKYIETLEERIARTARTPSW